MSVKPLYDSQKSKLNSKRSLDTQILNKSFLVFLLGFSRNLLGSNKNDQKLITCRFL